MARVKDKIALVTGGSRGIGAESARLLAKEGATVLIVDILNDLGRAVAEEIGPQARYYHLDVSSEADWMAVTESVRQTYGRLDILFNNAGISGFEEDFAQRRQDVEHVSLEDWRKIHAVNVDGVFLGCKHGIPLMKAHGGSIINMSSRSGMVGSAPNVAYCSSKSAVRNLTKSVAMYCAQYGYGIRCNSLHPGAILTSIWEPLLGNSPERRAETLAFLKRGIPLNDMGRPSDVAHSVLYLASDESRYLTGAEIVIDGGIMAGSTAAPPPPDPAD
ncbi:Oxidoreductase, short-chain dehydrogenase/reductase family [Azospirillum argentinense]|uniref:SDR family oxidoreductase n=1 Tax=Azospirillum argentinense TaxID=2970906 RepID=UPI0032DE81E9